MKTLLVWQNHKNFCISPYPKRYFQMASFFLSLYIYFLFWPISPNTCTHFPLQPPPATPLSFPLLKRDTFSACPVGIVRLCLFEAIISEGLLEKVGHFLVFLEFWSPSQFRRSWVRRCLHCNDFPSSVTPQAFKMAWNLPVLKFAIGVLFFFLYHPSVQHLFFRQNITAVSFTN